MRLKDDLSEGVLDIVRAAKEYSPKDPETGKRHKKVLVNETKSTGSVRHPPIPGFICKALDLHLRTFVPDNPTAFLFTGPRTCEVVNAQTVRNAWYRARKSVPRLEEKKVSLYNLRHRAISHMKAYTNSDKTVMEFAGHERLDTDRHYQHRWRRNGEESFRAWRTTPKTRSPPFPGMTYPCRGTPETHPSRLPVFWREPTW